MIQNFKYPSIFLFLMLFLLVSFNLKAQNDDQLIPLSKNVVSGKLANGLKYYILPNKKPENRVELRLAVNAGSIQEDDDQLGLAHFVEHMAFNGTKHFAKNELVSYLESLGVKFGPDLNAYTSFDETVYMLQLPTDNQEVLDKGFTVLADWAFEIAFDDEEIDKERGVIMSEWRTGLGAEQRMRNKYFPQLFYGSRYVDRLPIGDTAIIKNAPYETFRRFYKDWYRPDLMAVIVVGDIDIASVEKMIKNKFSYAQNPHKPRPRTSYNLPEHDDIKVSIVTDPEATRNVIRLLYKHPIQENMTLSSYSINLKKDLYNEMLNNRLDELTLSPEAPFMYGYSGYGRQIRTADAYYSYAVAADDKIKEALHALVTENERVKRHGFTQSELDRAKIELLKRYENNFDEKDKISSATHARKLVAHFLSNDPVIEAELDFNLAKTFLPRIRLVDVNKFAKVWITDKNTALVVTKPDNNIQISEDVLLKTIKEAQSQTIEPYLDFVSDKPLLEVIPAKGKIDSKSYNDSLQIHTFKLNNGIIVKYKVTDFKNDEILMTSHAWGGHSIYKDNQYWDAVFADAIANESGVGAFNKTELQKLLAGKTVQVSPYIGDLENGFNGSCKPKDLETLFQLIYLYYEYPRIDTSAFKSFINKQKNIYQNILTDPQYYFLDKVQRISYNNHPRSKFPSAEDFDKIDYKTVKDVFSRAFNHANGTTFYFVGNIDPVVLEDLARTYLAKIPVLARYEPEYRDVEMNLVKGKVTEHFKMGIAPKTNVHIKIHQDAPYSAEDQFKFNAAIMVLRIMMRESMREDKGGVYGVRVSGSAEKHPKSIYSLTVSFNADPPMTQELIETAKAEIEKLKAEGPSEENMVKIKETLLRQMESDSKENSFWLRQMENYDKYELSINRLLKYNERVAALTAKDIQEAANKYFAKDNYIEIIMHPNE
jgi:zinc protease